MGQIELNRSITTLLFPLLVKVEGIVKEIFRLRNILQTEHGEKYFWQATVQLPAYYFHFNSSEPGGKDSEDEASP